MSPTIDRGSSRAGTPVGATRDAIAARGRRGAAAGGFLLVTGHGVDPDCARGSGRRRGGSSRCRLAAKERYAARSAGAAGWRRARRQRLRAGGDRDSRRTSRSRSPSGADEPTGDPAVDAEWFPPNVWPAEVPELRAVEERYLAAMTAVSDDLLELCAARAGPAARHLRPRWRSTRPGPSTSTGTRRDRGRRAAAGPVPHRPAHRLRHGHRARPPAGRGRAPGRTSEGGAGWTRRTTRTRSPSTSAT